MGKILDSLSIEVFRSWQVHDNSNSLNLRNDFEINVQPSAMQRETASEKNRAIY